MRISKKWLSRFMDTADLNMNEAAAAITAAGFEVEGVEPMSNATNLVIGHIETCEMHPDSDHLHVTTVNTGDGIRQIVCGAPNVAAGQNVIVALPGAKLPGGEIKEGVIRGQTSSGMICSLAELGVDKHTLSEEQLAGIEILPEDAPVGNTDPMAYLGLDDVVLDISLTPNRSDCMAAFNMAAEAAAILKKEAVFPEYDGAADAGSETATELKVSSETVKCPLFFGKVIGSVTIKESPKWMKELLRASGMHSINNVVDISNIVMLETGQPMHFYDINAIPSKEITVKDGLNTTYTALDGVEYQLQEEDTVITTQGKPIGIAGIMGGDDSKIEENTTGLIIECASFDNVAIRNTARRLNLNTESSQRYAKGIEPLAAKKALDRAVQLLIEYADAKEIEQTVVFGDPSYTEKTITCTLDQINGRLGTDFSLEEVVDVFDRLHLNPVCEQEQITVTVPSSRQDLEGMADLSEEVIRMIGYDRLPSTLPLMEMTEGKLNPQQAQRRFIHRSLLEQGLQNAVTYTLISADKNNDAVLSCGTALELPAPLSEERRFLRTSLLPSLLEAAAFNRARNVKDVNMYEISDVTSNEKTEEHLAIVLSGDLETSKWKKFEKQADFYALKGIVEELLERAGINSSRIVFKANTADQKHFHPGRSAEVLIGKDCIGIIGEIHPVYGKKTGMKNAVIGELNLSKLLSLKKAKIRYTPISRYPSVSRDLAFIVKKDVPAGKIAEIIQRSGKLKKESIVRNVDIFDVYEGEHVAEDEKSVALNMTFQSDKQTLTESEINEVFNAIIEAIEKQCSAKLRSA